MLVTEIDECNRKRTPESASERRETKKSVCVRKRDMDYSGRKTSFSLTKNVTKLLHEVTRYHILRFKIYFVSRESVFFNLNYYKL